MGAKRSNPIYTLIAGDALVMAIFTVVGFASHSELATSGIRLLTTFLPLCLAWGITAPWLDLYNLTIICQPRQLVRILPAALLAAPLAAWLRGWALNAAILPLFILVMAATVAIMMLAWRSLWLFVVSRQARHG
jgi:hypothetical protein